MFHFFLKENISECFQNEKKKISELSQRPQKRHKRGLASHRSPARQGRAKTAKPTFCSQPRQYKYENPFPDPHVNLPTVCSINSVRSGHRVPSVSANITSSKPHFCTTCCYTETNAAEKILPLPLLLHTSTTKVVLFFLNISLIAPTHNYYKQPWRAESHSQHPRRATQDSAKSYTLPLSCWLQTHHKFMGCREKCQRPKKFQTAPGLAEKTPALNL